MITQNGSKHYGEAVSEARCAENVRNPRRPKGGVGWDNKIKEARSVDNVQSGSALPDISSCLIMLYIVDAPRLVKI